MTLIDFPACNGESRATSISHKVAGSSEDADEDMFADDEEGKPEQTQETHDSGDMESGPNMSNTNPVESVQQTELEVADDTAIEVRIYLC